VGVEDGLAKIGEVESAVGRVAIDDDETILASLVPLARIP